MIKQIIWDFDGVIIFSDQIREDGFRNVLGNYDNIAVEKMLTFHRANGGLSRYVKFRYLLEEVLEQKPDESQVQQLANNFSAIMRVKMVDPNKLNKDALKFITDSQNDIIHHIASGSDGNELRFLCKELGIDALFKSINGSPTSKIKLVSEILSKGFFKKDETCLIGDAINDMEAAIVNGIAFYGYNNSRLNSDSNLYINNFDEFNWK